MKTAMIAWRRRTQIDFIDTYSAGYRREIFLENGGFDPIFTTASVEDQEFSFRLAQKGYRLVFVPGAACVNICTTPIWPNMPGASITSAIGRRS